MDARTDIAKAIAAITDIDEAELSSYIEIPPDRSMGDYAFPCFRLAKAMRFLTRRFIPSLKKVVEGRIWTMYSFSASVAGIKSSTFTWRLKGFFFISMIELQSPYSRLIRGSTTV